MVKFTQARLLSNAVLVTMLTGACAFAGSVAPDLNALSPNTVVQVIVGLHGSQAPSQQSMGGVVQLSQLPNAIVAQTTAAAAIALSNDPAVNHVSVNHVMVGSSSPVYDFTPQTLQPVSAAYAGSVTSGSFGSGIGIAVIDSGINTTSPDLMGTGFTGRAANLASRVSYSQSFIA